MRVLKDWRLYAAGKTDRGREFQSLEIIGINELANAFVRLVSNLIAWGCWILENCLFRANEAFDWFYLVRTSKVARECLGAPLHRCEQNSRQGRIWALYKKLSGSEKAFGPKKITKLTSCIFCYWDNMVIPRGVRTQGDT